MASSERAISRRLHLPLLRHVSRKEPPAFPGGGNRNLKGDETWYNAWMFRFTKIVPFLQRLCCLCQVEFKERERVHCKRTCERVNAHADVRGHTFYTHTHTHTHTHVSRISGGNPGERCRFRKDERRMREKGYVLNWRKWRDWRVEGGTTRARRSKGEAFGRLGFLGKGLTNVRWEFFFFYDEKRWVLGTTDSLTLLRFLNFYISIG